MKILVIGPSWIGDMVMSQSLYITLKKRFPECVIDVMAPKWCMPILDRMPEVNSAIDMPLGHGQFEFWKRRALGKQLKNAGYTHAYILPKSAKSALIPWFAAIPNRIGWRGEFRYGLLTDLRSNMKSFQYMTERYYALAYPKKDMTGSEVFGGIEKSPYPKLHIDKQIQLDTLKKYDLDTSSKIIGLCPGAAFGSAKKWPEHYYSQVAEKMCRKGYQVWIFGSQGDLDACQTLYDLVPNELHPQLSILAGKTSLIEAVDLLAACDSIVGNDSGLLHVASALDCHVVGIYGPTTPKYAPPLTDNKDIVYTDIECSPCAKRECPLGHNKCMNELHPDRVLARLETYQAKLRN
ncbi:lipopolysaccharide heptosyltransferase II [Vibrio lentus]|uniref:lipopolysaccharide heptosyltransferase II n=1 Tax=Vibrio lentus TaxID=136468 RepID=UPI000C83D5B1|nr:lipopolysaccharide heptosyltransferase II [Vibrio lentus]MCL4114480.1 hypothetical protein [Idotea baltica]PMJ07748.1 lipopolysaccharide heptosyltransferase II [Vibrio lentus]PMN68809.1 lipopolysaccharide heptosyltransferase II [Vibrio lentus]